MKAVLGDAGMRASVPQKFIAPRSAVSANDIDFAIRIVKGSSQSIEKVKKLRIEMMYIPGPMIPKKVIQLSKSVGQVGVAAPIHDVQPLASMRVVEAQTVFPGFFKGIGGV